jgi:predicted RNase H-like HicB family nuclease
MTMYVLIENKPEGKVIASLLGWPDMTAQGNTEAEAVGSLRRSFTAHLREAKVIPLELDVERPWLQTAGMFKDDPFADELDAAIAKYRRERDADDVPDAPQDHAA